MVCLGNELRSFCHFWDSTQLLHFRLFCWLIILLKLFQKTPKFIQEATITLIQRSNKDITKRENYRPMLLMNIGTKILNKILGIMIQQHIKRSEEILNQGFCLMFATYKESLRFLWHILSAFVRIWKSVKYQSWSSSQGESNELSTWCRSQDKLLAPWGNDWGWHDAVR